MAERLLTGTPFNPSSNEWDWLGSGVYFWEANPKRGLEFAHELQRRTKTASVTDPYVVGAVIDLGFCLDLMSSTGTKAVAAAYDAFAALCAAGKVDLPQNSGGDDSLFRNLDCAVINHLHDIRRQSSLPAFDSVRGVFYEGGPLYAGSGFREKTHIQICVCKIENIKGVFRVPDDQLQ